MFVPHYKARNRIGLEALAVGEEVFFDVVGWKGFYRVSNYGRIESLPRAVPMVDGRTYRVRGKFLKPAFNGHYYHVILSSSGKEELRLVHRLVLENFVGPAPEGQECLHGDRNTANNRLDNLRWGTPAENYQDRKRHGTTVLGRKFGKGNSRKLKDRVDELLVLWDTGQYTLSELATMFGVTSVTVGYHVKKRRRDGTRFLH